MNTHDASYTPATSKTLATTTGGRCGGSGQPPTWRHRAAGEASVAPPGAAYEACVACGGFPLSHTCAACLPPSPHSCLGHAPCLLYSSSTCPSTTLLRGPTPVRSQTEPRYIEMPSSPSGRLAANSGSRQCSLTSSPPLSVDQLCSGCAAPPPRGLVVQT